MVDGVAVDCIFYQQSYPKAESAGTWLCSRFDTAAVNLLGGIGATVSEHLGLDLWQTYGAPVCVILIVGVSSSPDRMRLELRSFSNEHGEPGKLYRNLPSRYARL